MIPGDDSGRRTSPTKRSFLFFPSSISLPPSTPHLCFVCRHPCHPIAPTIPVDPLLIFSPPSLAPRLCFVRYPYGPTAPARLANLPPIEGLPFLSMNHLDCGCLQSMIRSFPSYASPCIIGTSADLCNMSRLQFLLLDHNSISAEIPQGIGNCSRVLELQVGSNYLSDVIPPEIGRIKNLHITLNLSFNHLKGQIPRELGKLDKLVTLDVSNNQLFGYIPPELKGMLSLIEVNYVKREARDGCQGHQSCRRCSCDSSTDSS